MFITNCVLWIYICRYVCFIMCIYACFVYSSQIYIKQTYKYMFEQQETLQIAGASGFIFILKINPKKQVSYEVFKYTVSKEKNLLNFLLLMISKMTNKTTEKILFHLNC